MSQDFITMRAVYPAILIVVASYYDLFAVIGGGAAIGLEAGITVAFLLVAIVGFRTNLWVVAVALTGHGVFDLFHDRLVVNAGVPLRWPMFCASFDVIAGAYLVWRILTKQVGAHVPDGNTGGSDVSAFKPMAIADDLAALIGAARPSVSS